MSTHRFTFNKSAASDAPKFVRSRRDKDAIQALLNQTVETTVRKNRNQVQRMANIEAPFATFHMDDFAPHGNNNPGFARGKFHTWTSDMDGDGSEDLDDLGKPIAKTLKTHLDNSPEWKKVEIPMSSLSAHPRVQKFLKRAGRNTMQGYIHTNDMDAITANFLPFKQIVEHKDLLKHLTAARDAGHGIYSDTRDMNSLPFRMLNGNGEDALNAFWYDKTPPLSAEKATNFCDCANHRDNHDGSSHDFLPRIVMHNGEAHDGAAWRSARSPLRTMFLPKSSKDDSARFTKYTVGTSEEARNPGNPDDILLMAIAPQPTFIRKVFNTTTRALPSRNSGKARMQKDTLPKISESWQNCKTCGGTQTIDSKYPQREGVAWLPDMMNGTSYEPVVDAETGKPSLVKRSAKSLGRLLFSGTKDDVCPDCKDSEKPGKYLRPGKPERAKEEFFVKSSIDDMAANPIIRATRPTSDKTGWKAFGDPDCVECGGDYNNYKKDGKACTTCMLGDMSKIDLDNIVSPKGVDYIQPDKIFMPPSVMHALRAEHFRNKSEEMFPGENLDINPDSISEYQRNQGEKPLLSDTTDHLTYIYNNKRDRERGIVRRKGRLGVWSHVIDHTGAPVLSDYDQKNIVGTYNSGFGSFVIPKKHLKELNKIKKDIMSGPNADDLGSSQQLGLLVHYFRNNMDEVVPKTVSQPGLPEFSTRLPENLRDVSVDDMNNIDLEEPGYTGRHKSVMPHIAKIDAKMATLRKKKVIGEDPALDGMLGNLYNLSDDAAKGLDNYGAFSTESSRNLADTVKGISNHIADNHGVDALQTIMPYIHKLAAPYILQKK